MMGAEHSTGASVVGRLTDVAPWEADLIMSIRLWMDSPEGQAQVSDGYAEHFDAAEARAELRRFSAFLADLCTRARRPLVRHGLGCTCIGSDEAVLQTLVREAARGDLEEAAMIASLLVPADHAEPVALMAARVGHAMQRMAQRTPAPNADHPPIENRLLH